jgi:aminoacylase
MLNELSLQDKEQAIDDFIEIIKFKTISNLGITGEYLNCAEWLINQLNLIGLDNVMILPESKDNKPIVVASFLGSRTDLPQILLNSHYDVVPIMEDSWTVPAFDGFRRDGRIYGRGTQDMKCVCVQYVIALKKLKELGFQPKRTMHLSFVPDEEIGGADGMNILMQTTWYSNINIGIALDEGLASENNDYSVFYGERLPWWVRVKSVGNTGHASRFIEGTAVEQIIGVANKALAFREDQKDLLHGKGKHYGCSHAVVGKKSLGDVTSLNMTVLRAGVSAGGVDVLNVIPSEAEAGFDIRISPLIEPYEMADKLSLWCEEVTSGLKQL